MSTHTKTRTAMRRGFLRGMRLSRGDRKLLAERQRMYATFVPEINWNRTETTSSHSRLRSEYLRRSRA